LPGAELCKPTVQEHLEKGEELMVLDSNYRIKLEQGVKLNGIR
jgi:hypothetical protein